MMNFGSLFGQYPFMNRGGSMSLVLLLIAWEAVWKGMALWRAARKGEKGWFVALLLLNTLGILPLVYLYIISPDKLTKSKSKNAT